MQNIEIIEESDKFLILCNNETKRNFLLNYPSKISNYNISSLYIKQTIYNKILIKDFSYIISSESMNLKFEFDYEGKQIFLNIECEETFLDQMDIKDCCITNEDYKKCIYSLKNQINNLNSKNKLLEDKISILEDKISILEDRINYKLESVLY